jgi:heme/copper-type cytochrome/quinol oxidase subunit 3
MHSSSVKFGIKIGMLLFICSEIILFVSFFWSFIHRRSVVDINLSRWPPLQVFPLDPLRIPLFNTVILLSSGVTVTWRHHLILEGNYRLHLLTLVMTIFLGLLFSFFQLVEYINSPFGLSDRVFGSVFFMSTGFHGAHVIIGSIFLLIRFVKRSMIIRTSNHMVGFECSAWY